MSTALRSRDEEREADAAIAPPPPTLPWEWAGLALVLVGAAIVSGWGFTERWNDVHHGSNGARYSLIARNYLHHDWLGCRLAPRMDTVPSEEPMFVPYLRHPILVPLFVSFSFAVFGEHEWAARLVALLGHLGAIVVLWRLVRRFSGPTAGLTAAALYATLPMSAYYGGMVDPQGSLVVLFSLLAVRSYLCWSASGRRRAAGATALWLALAAMADWPGFYLAGLLPAWEWLARRRAWRPGVLWFAALAVALGVAFLVYVHWITGDFRGIYGKAVRSRSLLGFLEEPERLRVFAAGILAKWRPYFPLSFLLLGAIGLVALFRRRSDHGRALGAVAVSTAVGILHVGLFPQGAWIHPYWAYLLAPPLAWLGGIGVGALSVRLGRRAIGPLLGVVVAVTAWHGFETWQRRVEERTTIAFEFAERLREGTRPGALILTIERVPNFGTQVLYYLRRRIAGPVQTPEQLDEWLKREDPPSHLFARQATLMDPEHRDLVAALLRVARPAPPLGRGAWKVFRFER